MPRHHKRYRNQGDASNENCGYDYQGNHYYAQAAQNLSYADAFELDSHPISYPQHNHHQVEQHEPRRHSHRQGHRPNEIHQNEHQSIHPLENSNAANNMYYPHRRRPYPENIRAESDLAYHTPHIDATPQPDSESPEYGWYIGEYRRVTDTSGYGVHWIHHSSNGRWRGSYFVTHEEAEKVPLYQRHLDALLHAGAFGEEHQDDEYVDLLNTQIQDTAPEDAGIETATNAFRDIAFEDTQEQDPTFPTEQDEDDDRFYQYLAPSDTSSMDVEAPPPRSHPNPSLGEGWVSHVDVLNARRNAQLAINEVQNLEYVNPDFLERLQRLYERGLQRWDRPQKQISKFERIVRLAVEYRGGSITRPLASELGAPLGRVGGDPGQKNILGGGARVIETEGGLIIMSTIANLLGGQLGRLVQEVFNQRTVSAEFHHAVLHLLQQMKEWDDSPEEKLIFLENLLFMIKEEIEEERKRQEEMAQEIGEKGHGKGKGDEKGYD